MNMCVYTFLEKILACALLFNTVHLFIFEDSVAHTHREQSNFQKSPFQLFSK